MCVFLLLKYEIEFDIVKGLMSAKFANWGERSLRLSLSIRYLITKVENTENIHRPFY